MDHEKVYVNQLKVNFSCACSVNTYVVLYIRRFFSSNRGHNKSTSTVIGAQRNLVVYEKLC